MVNKKLQLVTYEQAVRLKNLGFNWETREFYYPYEASKLNPQGEFNLSMSQFKNHNYHDEEFSAPTVALALQWVRNEKGIPCWVEHFFEPYSDEKWIACWFLENDKNQIHQSFTEFKTYEEAEMRLLFELLDYLQTQKNKENVNN